MTSPLPNLAALTFKHSGDERKYFDLDFRVHFIVDLFRYVHITNATPTLVVTDIDTEGIHMPNSPHYHKRAVDLRIPYGKMTLMEDAGDWVNGFLDYGRGYKAVLVGKLDPNGRHNDHVHIQVPGPYRIAGSIKL